MSNSTHQTCWNMSTSSLASLHPEHFDKRLMIKQLHEFCEINSGTNNIIGLVQMNQALSCAFSPIADHMQTHPFPPLSLMSLQGELTIQPVGDALFIQKRPELKRRILLSGHMDTVYGETHPFQQLKYINDNCINGPGVTDMKGGLIVMLHALMHFEKQPFATQLGWDVLINADEETGSLGSSTLLDTIAPKYQAALVYEPAMNTAGLMAKNRKGSGKLTIVASGRAAHAGRAFEEGRNAICYLAEVITKVDALNGRRDGVTINIGLISGGSALNVVPDKAVAKLDVRISQKEDEHWVREQLDAIFQQMKRKDYLLQLFGSFDRPVKRVNTKTRQLFKRIVTVGDELGLTIAWQDSGGCCDGNNLSQHELPVIDTLGVRGGDIHSSNEFILLDSLTERASLSALLLSDLAQGGLEILS